MTFRLQLLFFIYIGFGALEAKSRGFEGKIEFVRETVFDTSRITIAVKGDMVRVDEFDNQRRVLSSSLVNLKEEKIVALSHERKLYAHIPVSPRISPTSNLEVNKTGNYKEILGKKCHQWRVKDVKRNTEIAYWVYEEQLDFFDALIKLFNRTEYSLIVFKDLPMREGFIPMLTEERTLLRKEKLKIALVQIDERDMSSHLFEIPAKYKEIRR